MFPDIPQPESENLESAPAYPDETSGKYAGISTPNAVPATHMSVYQEPHPWICAILFDETASCGSPGYFAEFNRYAPIRMICGTNPGSSVFSLSVPIGSYHESRQFLSREIPISFPDIRNDVAFPVGRWSEGDMAVFPAIIENEEQDVLVSSMTRVGGKVRRLRVGYLIFTNPPALAERTIFFEKLGCDPGIRFVMLEYPEG